MCLITLWSPWKGDKYVQANGSNNSFYFLRRAIAEQNFVSCTTGEKSFSAEPHFSTPTVSQYLSEQTARS